MVVGGRSELLINSVHCY